MMKLLITGGAGFVGSNLAIKLKSDFPEYEIICFDNLRRRGSELNLNRLKECKIKFIHGDVRSYDDFESIGKIDLCIDCSAEPSVLYGYNESASYLFNTNLIGTINCLEYIRKNNAKLIFLSTSRIYPFDKINSMNYLETDTRYVLGKNTNLSGISEYGISEEFPTDGIRTFYGVSKLASELIIKEYVHAYSINAVINRCGVICGPWQMGKVDQGFVVLWVASHLFNTRLKYIGYGGSGKQVRDILNIQDLYNLIKIQIRDIDNCFGDIYNVGGGVFSNISLLELTNMCKKFTKNKIDIEKIYENRKNDIPYYISDVSKINKRYNWSPKISVETSIIEIVDWINKNKKILEPVLN